tara:strand:+ start:399 stop:1001 length:603 start_codon:yes stop_codon:yes gene_type:complete
MKKRFLKPCSNLFLSLLMLCAFPTMAQAEVEDWYTYWGLGVGSIKYPPSVQQDVDALRNAAGVDSTTISADFLGFYWPVDWAEQSIAGFVIHSDSERLEGDLGWIQMNLYLYSFSFMRFFGSEPGDGFFLRGDVGVASGLAETSFGAAEESEQGFGLLFGIGYGFKINEGLRALLNFSHAERNIDDESSGATSLSAGLLF